jgi:predicted DNA-binding transcriptional regulator YafY
MLNQRQLWFLEELRKMKQMQRTDIEKRWGVASRTAKRDIAGLVAVGAIRFRRSGKDGYYVFM